MAKQMRFVTCAFPNNSWWFDDAKKFIFILNSYCFHNSCSLTILRVCVVLKFSFVFHNKYWALSLPSSTSNHSLPYLTILVSARRSLHSTSALLCNKLSILSLPLMLAAPLVGFFKVPTRKPWLHCTYYISSYIISWPAENMLTQQGYLLWNLDRLEIHSDLPASVSWVLGLRVYCRSLL